MEPKHESWNILGQRLLRSVSFSQCSLQQFEKHIGVLLYAKEQFKCSTDRAVGGDGDIGCGVDGLFFARRLTT